MRYIFIFIALIYIGISAKNALCQDYMNLESEGDCQFNFLENGFRISDITFQVKHTGKYTKNIIKKVKFRLIIKEISTQTIVLSKIYEKDITLYPEDVDYITVYLNKLMTKNYDCDFCLEYLVDFMPVY